MKLFTTTAIMPDHPFINNKYTVWYYAIINNAKYRKSTINSKTEIHHIIPDCFFINNRSKGKRPGELLGDPNNKENLVTLTYREHFICHRLLIKMTMGEQRNKMICAFYYMSNIKSTKINSQSYQKIKNEYSKIKSINYSGNKNPNYGNKWTDQQKEWIRNHNKGLLSGEKNPMYGQPCSDERKQKISNALKGRKQSPDTISKKVIAMTGKKHSEEAKIKRSNSLKGKKKSDQHKKNLSISRKISHNDPELKKRLSEFNKTQHTITDGQINVRQHRDLPIPTGFRIGITRKRID